MGWANSKVLQSLFEPKTFEGGGKDQKNFQPPAHPMESLNCVAIFLLKTLPRHNTDTKFETSFKRKFE